MARTDTDDRVTKRKVVCRSVSLVEGPNGKPMTAEWEKVDYVREDILDAYLETARAEWQVVTVADGYDAGPQGYDGATYVPDRLNHPLAGTYFPATDCGPKCTHAPAGARVVIAGQEG